MYLWITVIYERSLNTSLAIEFYYTYFVLLITREKKTVRSLTHSLKGFFSNKRRSAPFQSESTFIQVKNPKAEARLIGRIKRLHVVEAFIKWRGRLENCYRTQYNTIAAVGAWEPAQRKGTARRALRCVALRVRGEATSNARNARARKKKGREKVNDTRAVLPVIFPAFVACLS